MNIFLVDLANALTATASFAFSVLVMVAVLAYICYNYDKGDK